MNLSQQYLRLALSLCGCLLYLEALAPSSDQGWNRREWAGAVAAAGSACLFPTPSNAAGLAAKLAKRDPTVLANSVFNVPPSAQVYPEFLRGTWDMSCRFGGFLFPSQKISREKVTSNSQIPGFQKCSIAAFSDVGKDVHYDMRIDPSSGLEDRAFTLTNQINANLGYKAVSEILYNVKSNPNRLSVDFIEFKTVNAERIELFCNARESEMLEENGVFVCSEYVRQVTFGTGSQVGIPRQAVGNYAHFWTWKMNADDPSLISGVLLTAAYLDPQDPLFFDEPSKPVAVYSHVLSGTRKV
jgi:hypothetical protein